jgi:hypothetical protein
MEHIYERCITELEPLITDSISKALTTAPTIEAEREIIEVASGTKRVRKRYIRERAISTILLSDSNILPYPVRVLVELRYRADGGRAHYTELAEGQISSVWREVAESLPEEVVKLIVEDNSF